MVLHVYIFACSRKDSFGIETDLILGVTDKTTWKGENVQHGTGYSAVTRGRADVGGFVHWFPCASFNLLSPSK